MKAVRWATPAAVAWMGCLLLHSSPVARAEVSGCPSVKLNINKAANPGAAFPFFITVQNTYTEGITGASLQLQLPANVAFKQAVMKRGKGGPHGKGNKATKHTPGTPTFSLPELPPGTSLNIKVNVKLAKCALPANITFNAQVSNTSPSHCLVNADPVVVTVRNHDRSSLKPCDGSGGKQGGGKPQVEPKMEPTSHIVHPIAPDPDTPIAAAGTKSIQFNGGAVRTADQNVYLLWYGTHSATTKDLIINAINNVGGTAYWNIMKSYLSKDGVVASQKMTVTGSWDVGLPKGMSFTDLQGREVISAAIGDASMGKGSVDPNGIYLLLTAKDVNFDGGMCTKYCGYHSYFTKVATNDVVYGIIGDPTSAACSGRACGTIANAPNGDPAADTMISIVMHELEEAISDPYLNAWYCTDRASGFGGYENADLCSWTFGATTYKTAAGMTYNVMINGKPYYIQQNFDAGSQQCTMVGSNIAGPVPVPSPTPTTKKKRLPVWGREENQPATQPMNKA